jgi:hypothetical protein
MQISTIEVFIILLFIIYIICQIFTYKKYIDKQNLKLFNFYLDRKLIAKLIKIVNSNHPSAFEESIQVVKNYYDISQILIYEPSGDCFSYPEYYRNLALEGYLHDQYNAIVQDIDLEGLFAKMIYLDGKRYKAHIIPFNKIDTNSLMVFLFCEENFARQEEIYTLDLMKEIISLVRYKSQNNNALE